MATAVELPISAYAQNLLDGSMYCHRVNLKKGEHWYTGIYNDLSYWGIVLNSTGQEVETLQTEWDEEYQKPSNFCSDSFTLLGGYEIV